MDHNPQGQGQGQRRQFHRGRRGSERRGQERRGPLPQQQHAQEPSRSNDVDVEQIMRDIRARIAQRNGVELTNQQIQDLAARRLESILDPRGIKPALLDQLRRASGTSESTPPKPAEPPYTFEETTLFESHNALTRFFRALLKPILKLFFNPNPLIRALNIQARLNTEVLAREAERDRRQAEWNALHYELLQRVVTEITRVSLEGQSLSLKVESLSGKVDFNERRVRGIEGSQYQARPSGRRDQQDQPPRREPQEQTGRRDQQDQPQRRELPEPPPSLWTSAPAAPAAAAAPEGAATDTTAPPPAQGEGTRRRRRRRRGRRGAGAPGDPTQVNQDAAAAEGSEGEVGDADDFGDEDERAAVALGGEADSPVIAEALARAEDEPPVQAIVAPDRTMIEPPVAFEPEPVAVATAPADPGGEPASPEQTAGPVRSEFGPPDR